MKMVNNTSGYLAPVSNEEYSLLTKITESNTKLYKDSLTLRELELSNKLVSRGVMDRKKDYKNNQYYIKF